MGSQLDEQILDALEDLQWEKSSVDLSDSIAGDWINYSNLVSWITQELKSIHEEIEETVNPIRSPDDLPAFRMELSCTLKELGCPYSSVMNPPLSDRFDSPESRKIVISFLLSELEAGRMLHVNKLSKKGLKVELSESPTAKLLKEICIEIGLQKPPENVTITTQSMWNNILNNSKKVVGASEILDPLFKGLLSPNQLGMLDNYFKELKSDYAMRREMLLKRLDVTVQSFHWSDRLKGDKGDKMTQVYRKLRPDLKIQPSVEISDIFAARADLAIVEKTSSTSVRKNTRSAVNKVVIGKVPDRGGRPNEVEPPPPEMPSWQQRQGGPPAQGASGWIQNPNQRGGGPRGGAGGRVQGGWSGPPRGGRGNQEQQSYQGDHQQNNRGGQQQQSYGGGGYQQQQGGQQRGGYYQHDSRDNNDDKGGYYNNQDQGDQGYGQRNQNQGCRDNNRDGGGRGGGRGKRY